MINLKEWETYHPGGKFVLQKNLTRDITKFWYGGYQMVQSRSSSRQHMHSNLATRIVNGFIIGVLEGQEKVKTHLMNTTQIQYINSVTNCLKLTL